METVELVYRGYVIKHQAVSKVASECQVHVESENPNLLSRLRGQRSFEDPKSVERAITKAIH